MNESDMKQLREAAFHGDKAAREQLMEAQKPRFDDHRLRHAVGAGISTLTGVMGRFHSEDPIEDRHRALVRKQIEHLIEELSAALRG